MVGPNRRSASSLNGTWELFPYISEVEAINTFLLYLLADSNTLCVPSMFVSITFTGSLTIRYTPTAAAR